MHTVRRYVKPLNVCILDRTQGDMSSLKKSAKCVQYVHTFVEILSACLYLSLSFSLGLGHFCRYVFHFIIKGAQAWDFRRRFFWHKSGLTRPWNTDLEQFPFFSKICQDIQIFYSYAHAQHAHIVTTLMPSISIVLLHVCSAYAYCYYAYAQYKHSNKSKMLEIYAYAEHTRSNYA